MQGENPKSAKESCPHPEIDWEIKKVNVTFVAAAMQLYYQLVSHVPQQPLAKTQGLRCFFQKKRKPLYLSHAATKTTSPLFFFFFEKPPRNEPFINFLSASLPSNWPHTVMPGWAVELLSHAAGSLPDRPSQTFLRSFLRTVERAAWRRTRDRSGQGWLGYRSRAAVEGSRSILRADRVVQYGGRLWAKTDWRQKG